jgi:hypothetical protein
MASSWQLWLSSRPTQRSSYVKEPFVFTAGDAIRYDFIEEDDGRRVVKETHYMDKAIVREGKSGPPL